jgi:hypothetical protein
LAAPVVDIGDQPRCDQRARTNGGGDTEIGELTIEQLQRRVRSGYDSHEQEGNP